ncbi:unnamed protein product, partial [Mesorhabditis spiculigera]
MDSDDDIPTLPEDTLQLIAQFRQEQKRQEEAEQTGAGEISENWQLSQFWYTPETARALCQEATKALLEARGGGNVAVISAPTLLQYFGDVEAVKEKKINLRLFEYDDRFRIKYPDEYINFDYRSPLLLPEDLRNTFDLVIADPPFLSDECLVKTCQSVRLLGKQDVKIIFYRTASELPTDRLPSSTRQ